MPAASSAELFVAGFLPLNEERQTDVCYKVAWDMPEDPKYAEGPMLLWNLRDGFSCIREGRAHWIFDRYSILIPCGPHDDDCTHFLELFASGFGVAKRQQVGSIRCALLTLEL